jgi:oligopeptidase B
MKPPVAPMKPQRLRRHGDVRVDEYAWLRQRDDPEVVAYLKAENAYTARRMRGTEALQTRLFREMRGRIKETDVDVPVRVDDYFYYSRTKKGQQYPIYCRKRGSLRGKEEVLLDQNRMAKGRKYLAVGFYRVSPDHRLLAYGVDTEGSERFTLRVKDLHTGRHLRDALHDVSSAAWASDSRTLFYVVLDRAHRPYKLYRHTLGQRRDRLVHHERNEAFFASVSRSRSRAYVFLDLHARTTSEVRFLPADRPRSRLRLVQRRRQNVEYAVDHRGDHFYILHNHRAKNFTLVRAPVRSPSRQHWRTVVAARKNVTLEDVAVFDSFLAVFEREDGLRHIRILESKQKRGHRVEFREPAYALSPGTNPEFRARHLRFHYTSLVTPDSVFDYDVDRRRPVLRKRAAVLGGYRPERYRSERLTATAPDGTRIAISLVYRKGTRKNGRNPMLLTGYGAYGFSRDPTFSSIRLSLLDRGVLFAIAHVRGGGDLGRGWYEDGKFLKKKRTFTDFIACAEALVAKRYTAAERLAISGGSAGGLLVGAVVNRRPDLFRVVVADVPFVDVLNTMLDPTLPLTVIEYDEWGNPQDKKYYRYIKSYSPYDNVRRQAYPIMLVTAGLNDPRVGFWEPAKWVARLRRRKTDDNELLLKTEMGSGHFGASGRYDYLKELAFEYAFILTRLGVPR